MYALDSKQIAIDYTSIYYIDIQQIIEGSKNGIHETGRPESTTLMKSPQGFVHKPNSYLFEGV